MECLPEGYPYEIYYFSRNLEHVLHNISEDLSDEEKEDLAFETAMRYRETPEDFLKFLKDKDFCCRIIYGNLEIHYGEWKFSETVL